MVFSRQEYWSGLPFPPPGDLPDLGNEPTSAEPLRKPYLHKNKLFLKKGSSKKKKKKKEAEKFFGTSSLQDKNLFPSAIILLGAGQARQDLRLASHAGINQVQPCLSFNTRRHKVQLRLFEYR